MSALDGLVPQILAAYAAGEPLDALARRYGVARTTISAAVRRAGGTVRPRGNPWPDSLGTDAASTGKLVNNLSRCQRCHRCRVRLAPREPSGRLAEGGRYAMLAQPHRAEAGGRWRLIGVVLCGDCAAGLRAWFSEAAPWFKPCPKGCGYSMADHAVYKAETGETTVHCPSTTGRSEP